MTQITERDLSMFESAMLLVEDAHTSDAGIRNMLRILVRTGALPRILAVLNQLPTEGEPPCSTVTTVR
jgi:hypothetical protein